MNSKFTLCTALAALPVVLAAGCKEEKSEAKRPNIIVILADDLGYGDMSAYGATSVKTPNLDRLANEGVCFTSGYATSATSTPSRYALFTGMYPWKNPGAEILAGDAPLIIAEDQFTLPSLLQDNGYVTGAIGKWHLGMGSGNVNWNERVTPGANEIGFDYSCLIAATNDRVPTVYVENGNVVGLNPENPIEVSYEKGFEGEPTAISNPELMTTVTWKHGHNATVVNGIPRIGFMRGGDEARWVDEDMADYFVGKVADFIDENKEKPFFLYYGLHQPHVPRAPHSRFVGSTDMGPRGDAIVEGDWCVGELLAKLEKEGLLENTLIIFSSDNGPVLNDGYDDGAPELLGEHKPAGILRGGKYSLFEGGTRVPFMVYWKGEVMPIRSSAMVSQLDIAASVADLLGMDVPQGLDSQNHIETLLGRDTTSRQNYVMEAMGRLAYRKGNYVLIPPYAGARFNQTGNEVGNVEKTALFDVSVDPSQLNDIAAENPELVKQMFEEFKEITAEACAPTPMVGTNELE